MRKNIEMEMSSLNRKDFDDRLAELSNWQVEQQKKLKAFQEAQRRLLDLEHQNVLNSIRTNGYDLVCRDVDSGNFKSPEQNKSDELKNTKSKEGLFYLNYQPVTLTELKSPLLNIRNYSPKNDSEENFFDGQGDNEEEKEFDKPRRFLRRGEGLARFRMSLDDFKDPPRIYKDKKIKTYLNCKPETGSVSSSVKSAKSGTKSCRRIKGTVQQKAQNKSVSVPVKIFVAEKQPKQCTSNKFLETKFNKNSKTIKNASLLKTPMPDLSLKTSKIATEWYNVMKVKENESLLEKVPKELEMSDVQKKNDEKELQIFEMLEKKVDDSSFCSNSSFVDKLLEQSVSSTPSKSSKIKNNCSKKSYAQGLKLLRSQFLDEDQIKRFDELNELGVANSSSDEVFEDNEKEDGKKIENIESDKVEKITNKNQCFENHEGENCDSDQIPKVNKTLLQECIRDFKKFKHLIAENAHRIEEPEEEGEVEIEEEFSSAPKELRKKMQVDPHEIALKLRRKGLQDNVKQLLNWECPSKKRQPKRVMKKVKPKFHKSEKVKVEKEQSEKIIFDSTFLKSRLEELEKEIEIFRKENKNLEKLQKEYNDECTKFAKEKKEFEKQMQEEKEKLETRIVEEQKKLQKEKSVFEKYCKQVKNQPTRQEREEITNLKKEIGKLTETLSTKESRWGAAQARLRNQIKNLEKENVQLKAELDKVKKLSAKKVSFENERSLNSKIINVINSELGKLKTSVVKNVRNNPKFHPMSARVERHLEVKPIRRIKSVPNMEKHVEADVFAEGTEFEEKALASVSTDSGIDTNGSRSTKTLSSGCSALWENAKTKNSGSNSLRDSPRSPTFEEIYGTPNEKSVKNCTVDSIESAVCEAVFPKHDEGNAHFKLSSIKSRLEKLHLKNMVENKFEDTEEKTVESPRESSSSCEETSGSSEEEEGVNEHNKIDLQWKSKYGIECDSKVVEEYSNGTRSLMEDKLEENGPRERIFEDGSREVRYPNGNVKKIFPGSKIVKMIYYNGDIKETNIVEGSEKYYYAETKTWHTTYKDGLEVLEFPNGQTERRNADGSSEISFPNGCVRYCDTSGKDEWRFLDGTVIKTNESGHKILLMPNGQKEIHTKEYKRREYPDGTVKILYADGTQETRYATGRVRLKDKDGRLLMDSGGIR